MPPEPRYLPLSPPSALTLSSTPFPSSPPGFAIRAVVALRRWLQRLADALAPTELIAFDDATNLGKTHALAAVAHHGIPDALGDSAKSAAELAAELELDADAVHRTLRALATLGYFRLRSDGRFENNRLSRGLMGGKPARTREFLLYFASGSNAAAWSYLSHTLKTGDSPFDTIHGETVWDWFDRHADEREMFAHVMMGLTIASAPVIATLYPFGELSDVCDVGGGRGTLLSELLLRHPHLKGVLCDGEGVLESARELLAQRGVLDRVTLSPGSFFEKVPAGSQAYLLKNVLHDWDDGACGTILSVVKRACSRGTRLIVCEGLLEKNSHDPMGALTDLQMMVACSGGRERSEEELRTLLERAGFEHTRTFPFPTVSVLEAVAR